MAKRKTLKQNINAICEELFTEFIAASLYHNNVSEENAEAIFFSIAHLRTDFISRVSHKEPGLTAAKYFDDLIANFNAQASEIADQINNL